MNIPFIGIERATKEAASEGQIDVNGRMNVTHYELTDLLTRKSPGELYLKLQAILTDNLKLKQPEGIGSKIKSPKNLAIKYLKGYMLSE